MEKTNIKTILYVLNTLSKELFLVDEKDDKIIPKNKRKAFLDPSGMFAIVPKKKILYDTLSKIIDLTAYEPRDTPNLDFKAEKGEEIKSKYNLYYLKIIMKLCERYDSVSIKMKKDYPICFETEDFELILAPIIETA